MLELPQYELVQCFAVAVVSVLFVTWLDLRPLGIFFVLLLCYFLYRTQCNICLAIPPEFQRTCVQWSQRLRTWRQEKPTMFCAVSSCCLGALAVLGHLLSGTAVVLSALVLAALISTKYNFKIIKIEAKDYDWSSQLNTADNDDEFLLEDNETTMFVLERACDLTTLSLPVDDADDEERSDDLPSELMLPDNSLAEIDDNSSNNDEEVEELLPLVKKTKQNDVIEFKRGHFKRDSSISTTSSSSEESLSKGLQFPDLSMVDGKHAQQHVLDKSQSQNTLLEKGAKLLPGLMSNLMQWTQTATGSEAIEPHDLRNCSSANAVVESHIASSALATTSVTTKPAEQTSQRRVVTALDSSDESDFEILQKEDFA